MRGIADYEFLRPIGGGGNGRFFLAARPSRLPGDAEHVVVKVFAHHSTSDMFRRATARLRRCAAIRSPYLIPLFDAGQHDGVFYCAMEFLAGGSLAQPTPAVDDSLQVRAVGDAARALAALHLSGFTHAAVKPGNVLLDQYGAKLSDPNLCGIFAPGLRHSGRGGTESLAFTDPAALLGEPPVPEHDVWSIGLLLNWVGTGGTGYPDLPGDGLGALRHVITHRPIVSPTLAEPLAGIVRDCLVPGDRRPAVADVANRIAEAAAGMSALSG
jgi:serine/threonine protein kinase